MNALLGLRPTSGAERSFMAVATVAALASAPLAAGNLVLMFAAVHFDVNGISAPLVLLRAGASAAPLWKWGMVLDILGYYLPVVPLVVVLRPALHRAAPGWIDLACLCLVAYCLIGATGGAILATAVPTLMRDYAAHAAPAATLRTVFLGYADAIYRGAWNLLEEFMAGVGWVVLGVVVRARHRRLGAATVVLGVAALVDSVGTALDVDVVSTAGLVVYLVLAPLWALWTGGELRRALHATGGDVSTTPATAPGPLAVSGASAVSASP
jgi:hypothetical protein